MHSDFDPDDNFAHTFPADSDLDDEAALEAVAWQLLLLINPGDEDAARAQLDAWHEARAGRGDDADPLELLREATDWRASFHAVEGDTGGVVQAIDELAGRWNLRIDWGAEDAGDDEFLDATDVPALIGTAYDRLREHHYTLWVVDAAADATMGWITRSRDDESMRAVAGALGLAIRPGAA
jgi:hypothetical protein